MGIEGLGLPAPGSTGPVGAAPPPALLSLEESLLLLGLRTPPGPPGLRTAYRAAMAELQAQLRAGTLDPPTFRARADRLDLALRSALAAGPQRPTTGPAASGPAASGPAASGPAASGPPATGTAPAGSTAAPPASTTPSTPSSPATASGPSTSAAASRPQATTGATPTPVASSAQAAPAAQAGPTGPAAPTPPPAPGRQSAVPPAADPATRLPAARLAPAGDPGAAPAPPTADPPDATAPTVLKALPLMNRTPATPAQQQLWNAVVVPAAEQHAENAAALATAAGARGTSQISLASTHAALTLVMADLPQERRREIAAVAAGVYAQLEAVLPRAVLAGLPPRDHLGMLPFAAWTGGPEIGLTVLVVALALVAIVVWAGLR